MSSKLRDFNLWKVADVIANSTNTNSVSVVVNTDSSNVVGVTNATSNSSNERSPVYNADNVNFIQQG